jgi:hypothetical protein
MYVYVGLERYGIPQILESSTNNKWRRPHLLLLILMPEGPLISLKGHGK